MNQKRIVFLFCMVVFMGMFLTGCNSANKIMSSKGSLNIMLSPVDHNTLVPQSVSDHIAISKYVVTLSKGSTVTTQEVIYTSNTQEVIFTNLLVGDWNISVIAKDADNYDCYGGSAVGVVATTMNTVNVPLYLLSGELDCTVKLPQINGVNISSGIVKLIDPMNGTSVDMDLNVNGATGLVDFGSVKAGTWYMEAEIFDNTTPVAWGSGVLTIYPDRSNHALIEFTSFFESGDLKIIVTINESPVDPIGLTAVWQNSTVVLNWDANPETNIAGYALYRATSETDFKKILSYTLIADTTFTDTTVEANKTYFYWVQAYNSDGYSSELSASSMVSTAQLTGPNPLDLNTYDAVIYVDAAAGSDTTGDGSKTNPYQTVTNATANVLINNTAISIKTAGVYAIPNGLQSLLKADTRVDYIVDQTVRGQVVFDLKRVGFNNGIEMIEYNSFIGVVFKRSGLDDRIYEYFFDSSIPMLKFYNCVFANGGLVVKDFPIYLNNKLFIKNKEIYYNNCTFIPNFSMHDVLTDSSNWAMCYGDFVNCAFTNVQFTEDSYNLHEAVIDELTYQITSADWQNTGTGINPDGTQSNMGVFGGSYAWVSN